jgi:glycosyltransferase involved in cell wall biosynthesis
MPVSSPKISVVMPFYNAQKYIALAIESILKQTFSDFELILINDASTDGSDEIVAKYLQDERIIYIKNNDNKGIVYNLNLGLKLAKADIIARMDGDDVSELNRFEKQFDFLQNNSDISVLGSFVKIINSDGQIIDHRSKPLDWEKIRQQIIIYSPLVHPSVMFRKKEVLAVGGYREGYIYVEDIDLWYRLSYSGYKISNIPEFLLQYRFHENSTSKKSKLIAKKAFLLRMEAIKKFNLKISLKYKLVIYLQFAIGSFFPAKIQQFLEGLYKKIVYHEK